jgi:hypothetical protein
MLAEKDIECDRVPQSGDADSGAEWHGTRR